jgi:hypothetical protein
MINYPHRFIFIYLLCCTLLRRAAYVFISYSMKLLTTPVAGLPVAASAMVTPRIPPPPPPPHLPHDTKTIFSVVSF